MTLTDRFRINRTVWIYDYWMDVESVPMRGRRARRAELRTNLADATADVGFEQARRGLGDLRELARAAAGPVNRPRWMVGLVAAMIVFTVLICITLFGTTAWIDGVLAADASGGRVEGGPRLIPWITCAVDTNPAPGKPISMMATIELWALLLPTLAAYLLGSRIWRLIGGSTGAKPVKADPVS
ncbi:MAG: hypothetical protein CSA84_05600 [Actinomycetales bacterium]|nr:MAG: hypothetical protein CSA84_05600 [Actinomycetales bacterium]